MNSGVEGRVHQCTIRARKGGTEWFDRVMRVCHGSVEEYCNKHDRINECIIITYVMIGPPHLGGVLTIPSFEIRTRIKCMSIMVN